MKEVKITNAEKFNNEIERNIQILTKCAYVTKADLAKVMNVSTATIAKKSKELGVIDNEFGILVTDAIKKFKLSDYLNNLLRLRQEQNKS